LTQRKYGQMKDITNYPIVRLGKIDDSDYDSYDSNDVNDDYVVENANDGKYR
jgi:hypothetical protein